MPELVGFNIKGTFFRIKCTLCHKHLVVNRAKEDVK